MNADGEYYDSSEPVEPKSLLVVNSDPNVLDAVREALGDRPLEVHASATCKQALLLFKRVMPDLVVIDIDAVDAEAFQTIETLSAGALGVSIVALGSDSGTDAILRAIRCGAADFIPKPCDASLKEAIDRGLESRQNHLKDQHYREQLEVLAAERTAELSESNADIRMMNARLRQIVETVGSMTNYTTIDQFDAYLLTHFAVIMTPESGRIYHLEPAGLRLGYAVRSPDLKPLIPFPFERRGILDRALRARKHLLVTVRDMDDPFAQAMELVQPTSLLMFPLRDERQKVITLVVLLRSASYPFRGQDVRIGGIISSFSSEALHVARAAEDLRSSEHRFRELIHNVRNIVVRLDAEGAVTFLNDYAMEFFGRAKADTLQRPFVGTLVEPVLPLDEELKTLLKRAADPGSGVMDERLVRRAGGQVTWVAWTYRQLLDDDGGLREIVCVGTDISDRKVAEMALARERDSLQRLMDASPIGIAMIDSKGNRLRVNPVGEKLIGDDASDSVNGLYSLTGGAVQDWAAQRIPQDQLPPEVSLLNGQPINDLRIQVGRPDGRVLRLLVNSTPLIGKDGKVDGMVLVLRDVSQEQALEERLRQAQKMETVGQLAGGVAHDFNNLLLPIIGFSELLMKELDPKSSAYDKIVTIRKAGDRAKNLTKQLLAFSRKQVLDVELLDLNEVIVNLKKMVRRTIREDIDLQVVPASGLGQVRADATQIEQVLLNLAINAQHAMPRGGQLIVETANVDVDSASASSHADVKAGEYVMIAVSDNGCGMDKETVKHVFEPFYTTKEKGEGTGLGLAMVYGIVKQHNGAIWVYSEVGVGTSFKLYFPRVAAAVKAPVLAQPDEVSPLGSETVVLAEDDELVRNAAMVILRNNGYTVVEVEDIRQCISYLQESDLDPQLLLTDVVMPQFSGPELYTALSAEYPNLEVVYMSGYTEKVISRYGILQGGAYFLQKPFTTNNLLKTVREALDR